MTDPASNVTIQFSAPSGGGDPNDPGGVSGLALSLELDSDYNASVYGQSKSSFAPGETAYLRLTPGGGAYTMACSAGTVGRAASNVPYTVEDDLTFANEKSASLSADPLNTVAWEWLGRSGGTPLFNGRSVSVASPVTAVLHCEYTASGDRLRLTVTSADMGGRDELPVVVSVVRDGETASVTVTFSTNIDEDGGDTDPVPVDIEVKSYCDDSVIAGATVYINGVSVGTTNANGMVYAGILTPGVEYALRVTHPDFISSDTDVLSNDRFIISTS